MANLPKIKYRQLRNKQILYSNEKPVYWIVVHNVIDPTVIGMTWIYKPISTYNMVINTIFGKLDTSGNGINSIIGVDNLTFPILQMPFETKVSFTPDHSYTSVEYITDRNTETKRIDMNTSILELYATLNVIFNDKGKYGSFIFPTSKTKLITWKVSSGRIPIEALTKLIEVNRLNSPEQLKPYINDFNHLIIVNVRHGMDIIETLNTAFSSTCTSIPNVPSSTSADIASETSGGYFASSGSFE